MLKLGMVRYINTLPLVSELQPPGEILWGVPSRLNQALIQGEIDLGLISAAHYLKHQDELALLPGPCIGATGPSRSVFLYLNHTPPSLEGSTLSLTSHSATSAALLQVLCQHRWKTLPFQERVLNHIDIDLHHPCLVIGDQALRYLPSPSIHAIDLSEEWLNSEKLPFVFAVLAARQEALSQCPQEIQLWLEALQDSFLWGKRQWSSLVKKGACTTGLSEEVIGEYLNGLDYTLTPKHQEGLHRFATLCKHYNVIPQKTGIT